MLEAIPEFQDDIDAKNRKRKKTSVQKGRKKNLTIIPEEESSENEFDREHQEALEAFDAISVAKKHNNPNPKLSNGYLPTPTNFSPQPSTSHASMTTSNFSKSRNSQKGVRN